MTRAILLTSLLFGACFSGELGGVGPTVDAKVIPIDAEIDAIPPDMGPAAGCVDRGEPGIAFIHPQSGNARAGEGCVASQCHKNGQEGNSAPGFQFAGTIYKKGTTEPDPGAVVVIIPDNTAIPPIQAVADTAGNFYVLQVSGNAIPAAAAATVCPDLTKGHQTGKISLGTTPGDAGNCNGCHALAGDGGTQTPLYIDPVITL